MKHIKVFICVVIFLISCVVIFLMSVATAKPAVLSDSISDNERSAVVAGMLMGMDLSLALTGDPPLDKQRWVQIQTGLASVIQDCTTIKCVTDRIVAFRERLRLSVQPQQRYPEILR